MYRTLSHCSNGTRGRRAFIKQNALYLVPSLLPSLVKTPSLVAHENNENAIRIGLITDSHFADKNAAGSRHYRDSLFKIRQAVTQFNNSRIPIAIELGDFIDAADTAETELQYLHTINKAFQKFNGKRHYVLGNHCVWTLSKKHFLSKCEQNKSFYSFDHHGIHFIILDACFRSDAIPYGEKNYDWTDTEIPSNEQDWLTEDLKSTPYPTVCFVHQRLDVSNAYGVKSAPQIRRILEQSGKVLAVFQGHNHINEHHNIAGIHYCTLAAMVEGAGASNNAYSLLTIFENGLIKVTGFHQQEDYTLDH